MGKTGSLTVRKTTEDNANLAGWQFALYADAACTQLAYGPVSTDANGNATFSNVVAGNYYLKEIGHPNASINNRYVCVSTNPQLVTVKPGETATGPTFENNVRRGGIRITKTTNTGNNLGGWSFQIINSAGTVVATVTTNDRGIATAADLWPGTYTVREVQSRSGMWVYATTDKVVTVEYGVNDTPAAFHNVNYGQIQVTKSTNTGNNLSGWTFDLYNSTGTLVDTKTTGADGKVLFDKLTPDTYTVRERQGRAGMWIYDTQDKTVQVEVDKTAPVSFHNTNYGQLQVTKTTNTGNNLDGWIFDLYNSAGTLVDSKTTGADGKVLFDKLEPGTYTVQERQDRTGMWIYDTQDKSVKVEVNKTAQTSFHNINYGQLRVVKAIADGGAGADLGWTFNLWKVNGADRNDTSQWQFISSGTTAKDAADPSFTWSELEPGLYVIQEETVRDTHQSDTSYHFVTVEVDTTYSHIVTNIQYGIARVKKTTNTGVDLGDWVIDIYSDPDCTVLVTTLTTDANGNAWTYLVPGTFYFREQASADPYWISDTEVKTLVVAPGGDYTVNFLNNHMGKIQVVKTMATDGPVDGWQFIIRDAEGNEIEGSPFTTVEKEIDGVIVGFFETGLLQPGTYTIEEIIPADYLYYCKTENPVTVTVTAGADIEASFVNALRPGKITLDKVNWMGEHLAGATFLLEWSEDGTTWYPVTYSDAPDVVKGSCSNPDLVDGKVTTGADGKLEFGNLYPGLQYRLTETEAPEGYILLADYAYQGELPIDDLTESVTVYNSKGYLLPTTPGIDFIFVSGGIVLAMAAFVVIALMLASLKRNALPALVSDSRKANSKKGNKNMKKHTFRIFSLMLVLALMLSMATTAFAATSTTAVIDETKTGSLTIYKIDFTNAEKDGVWSNSYVSTGVYDPNVNNTLINGAVKEGDTDNTSTQGNGDTSYGYAIKGVEFTYLKVAKIRAYNAAEEVTSGSGNYTAHAEILYGFPEEDEFLSIIGLDGDDRYAPADISGEKIWYFRSDVVIAALRSALNNYPTSTKNYLESYVKNNGGTKMPETNPSGMTSASDLPLGLYLLVETSVPETVSVTCAPFLVSLPMCSVSGTNATNGGEEWLYDVTLYPKNSTSIPELEKTVRESKADGGSNDGSDLITDGYAHTATASGGDTLDFQIISTLPTITSAATRIKTYAFEDIADAGLTYNQNSVKIEWFKDKDCTEKITTWELADGKFKVEFGTNGDKPIMTISMTDDGLYEINRSDAIYAYDSVRRGYSDMTMRITYTADLNSDESVVYGEGGNTNTVILKWQRSNSNYIDLLVDDCHIYTFGLDMTKIFNDGKGDFSNVGFVLYNETNKQWIQAEQNAETGVYYMTGWAAAESNATLLIPTSTGKLIIKGLENDSYVLTETQTDNGYILLKDHINVVITVCDKEACGVYATDVMGLIQNDPRFGADAVSDGLYHNMPQKHLHHNLLTASAIYEGEEITMLADGRSAQALAIIRVINTRGWEMPPTGDQDTILMPLIGCIASTMCLCVCLFLVFLPRRKEKHQ